MATVKRNILLTPGPATTTDRVKYAQVVPDICPREKEFGYLMGSISKQLTRFVADTEHCTTVLFGGSGTAAVESILSSVVGEESVLILNNGAYGKRMCEIAQAYGIRFLAYDSSSHEAVELASLEAFIQASSHKISHLAVVHHETTTGLLNDIESIGNLCMKYSIDMIVDAISSYGAIPLRMKEMNISYLAASSNKNIQGMAGISFVIANNGKLEKLPLTSRKQRNYYLNLYAQYKFFAETGQMRFTPPVQTLYALKKAIEELEEEGIEVRYQRYSMSWKTLIEGITRLGLGYLVNPKHHSKLVTAIVEPECAKYDFYEMHDFFYDKGFTIYPGKLEGVNTFRIANIGHISHMEITIFLQGLEEYLQRINFFAKGD